MLRRTPLVSVPRVVRRKRNFRRARWGKKSKKAKYQSSTGPACAPVVRVVSTTQWAYTSHTRRSVLGVRGDWWSLPVLDSLWHPREEQTATQTTQERQLVQRKGLYEVDRASWSRRRLKSRSRLVLELEC